MKKIIAATALAFTLALTACETAPRTEEGRANVRADAANAKTRAENNDPSLSRVLAGAKAYAIFPHVSKGAVGVGGAYGQGCLYEGGNFTGYVDMSQTSIGLALGAQSYTEIIAFDSNDALASFKAGHMQFDAQSSAVAIRSGASTNAKFRNGVAVFTMDENGLMFEASIGGQRFTYVPK